MLRNLLSIASVAALVLAACGGEQGSSAGAADAYNKHAGTGASASDFTARDVNGNNVKLSTYLGKQAILLDFCATWCEPCVAEFPHLRRLYDANKDKGFVVFGVAMDGPETMSNVPAFAQRNQLNFPMLYDDDSHVAQLYNPKKSAPFSVLIDKKGEIAAIREGYNPGDEDYLARDVAKVLDSSAAAK